MRKRGLKVGSRVRFSRMPSWVKDLPEEVQRIFKRALGGVFAIVDFDRYGDLVLALEPRTRWLWGQIIVNCRYVDAPEIT
jgi:hypothetical protein